MITICLVIDVLTDGSVGYSVALVADGGCVETALEVNCRGLVYAENLTDRLVAAINDAGGDAEKGGAIVKKAGTII